MAPNNQSLDVRTVLRWTAFAASALWIAITVYSEFFDANPDRYSFRSPEVEARMRGCNGDFHRRYECKEAAIIAENQRGFVVWIGKVCIVLGPPIVLGVLMRLAYRGDPGDENGDDVPPPSPIKRRRVR